MEGSRRRGRTPSGDRGRVYRGGLPAASRGRGGVAIESLKAGRYIRSGASIVSSSSPFRNVWATHSASCTRARMSSGSARRTS